MGSSCAICGRDHPQCVFWKGSNSKLRMLPNLRETLPFTSLGSEWKEVEAICLATWWRYKLNSFAHFSFSLESLSSAWKALQEKNQKFHRWDNWSTTYQQQSWEKNLENSTITFCPFPDIFAVFSPIHLLPISELLSIQPLSEAKAYVSTTTFQ